MNRQSVLLEHAHVVHFEGAEQRSLAAVDGVVGDAPADAFRIDLRDHLIVPGLVNAHDHLQLNAIPALAAGQRFQNSHEWIVAFERFRETPHVSAAVAVPSHTRHIHGGLRNLLGGVTTVAHHDPMVPTLLETGFPVGLLTEFGWSHSLELGGARGAGPPRYGPHVVESARGTPSHRPWMIHLAEGIDAIARQEFEELEALGCVGSSTVLIHGVGITDVQQRRLVEYGASVVWCPASNLSLFGVTLDPTMLAAAGRLALGTDSRLTGSRDLLDELRVAAANSALAARDLLRLVTRDASRVLKMPRVGGLAPGQRADCLVIRSGGDPWEALLHTRRRDIRAVIRGGVPAIADHDFEAWFDHCGIDVVRMYVDGAPKLLARHLARPETVALEPGLEFG